MQYITRISVALAILLSGVALLPFVDVPAQTFEWQRYAGVYEEPELDANYFDGQPGSFFHFNGAGFGANSSVAISSNGHPLGNVTTDGAGILEFILDTANADQGSYYVTVTEGNSTVTAKIVVWAGAPLRPQEGAGDLFTVPAGTGVTEIHLPVIVK
ncbi:MAG TPA: hypothetical protein PK530_16170 [Anaerolineales bacterium]|nr:hypothetical protein [Anaerolineales bacterium]